MAISIKEYSKALKSLEEALSLPKDNIDDLAESYRDNVLQDRVRL